MESEKKLIDALKSGDAPSIDYLLKKNPNLSNMITDKKISLLTHAAYLQNPQVLEVVKKYNPKPTFWECIVIGNFFYLKYHLIKDESVIHKMSDDGFPPLTLACYFGHFGIVKKLAQLGCNLNLKASNNTKVGPIHAAIANENIEIMNYLIKKGADVNSKQANNITPIQAAVTKENLKICNILCKNGADIFELNIEGNSALSLAIKTKNKKILQLFNNKWSISN
jgi:uncharacterized protein